MAPVPLCHRTFDSPVNDARGVVVNASTAGRVGLLLALMMLAGCEKHRLDEQVKELCAKDGGVKVYETVQLAQRAEFTEYGDLEVLPGHAWGESAWAGRHLFVSENHRDQIRKSRPQARLPSHRESQRRSDPRRIGHLYPWRWRYTRSMVQSSSFAAPRADGDEVSLMRAIFRPALEGHTMSISIASLPELALAWPPIFHCRRLGSVEDC